MISQENLQAIQKLKFTKRVNILLQIFIFIISLFFSYKFNLTYSDQTSLVNDKLIDVSSIFFGIFLGCLYLFEKFKNNDTYNEFLFFCKILLCLNIIIIALSFIIILTNDLIPISKQFDIGQIKFTIKLQTLFFSFYISLFALTLFNIWRFIKIILIILKSKPHNTSL